MAGEWSSSTVAELWRESALLVEDGNHGEYRAITVSSQAITA
jgi:hypothetical protein